jgi:hypothetical protein
MKDRAVIEGVNELKLRIKHKAQRRQDTKARRK